MKRALMIYILNQPVCKMFKERCARENKIWQNWAYFLKISPSIPFIHCFTRTLYIYIKFFRFDKPKILLLLLIFWVWYYVETTWDHWFAVVSRNKGNCCCKNTISTRFLNISGAGKVAHGEEGRYLWLYFDNLDIFPKDDIRTLDRYVGIISNFVKTL